MSTNIIESTESLVRFLQNDSFDQKTGKKCVLVLEGSNCLRFRPLTSAEEALGRNSFFQEAASFALQHDLVNSREFERAYSKITKDNNSDKLFKTRIRFYSQIAQLKMPLKPSETIKKLALATSKEESEQLRVKAVQEAVANQEIAMAVSHAKGIENRYTRCNALEELACSFARMGDFESAYALAISSDIFERIYQILTLNDIAIIHAISLVQQNEFEKAIEVLQRQYSYTQGPSWSYQLCSVAHELCKAGFADLAIRFAETLAGQKIGEKDTQDVQDLLFKTIGESLAKQRRLDEAKRCAQKIAEEYRREDLLTKIIDIEDPQTHVPGIFLETIQQLSADCLRANHHEHSKNTTPGRLCELSHYDIFCAQLPDQKIWVFSAGYSTHGLCHAALSLVPQNQERKRSVSLTSEQYSAIYSLLDSKLSGTIT